MARYTLIDGYLDTMRSEIRWRRDLDDLVSEMEDHLYSTVEHLLAAGLEPSAAQQATLDRFGEPEVLAAVYASSNSGGIAVPTQSTVRAGTLALISAGLWLAAAVAYFMMVFFEDTWQVYYGIFNALILAAGVFAVLAVLGVGKRLGGLGVAGMIGVAVAGLGVVASLIAWAIPLWMGLQAIGYLTIGIAVLRRGTAPRSSTLAFSSGFVIGVAAFFAADYAEVGPVDSYGDYPVGWMIGTAIGCTILAAALIGWGTWLRIEEPAEIQTTAVPVA
ncbi:MAG: permease prefix domain 1-containing protein [Acidimicrobiia bacterium]